MKVVAADAENDVFVVVFIVFVVFVVVVVFVVFVLSLLKYLLLLLFLFTAHSLLKPSQEPQDSYKCPKCAKFQNNDNGCEEGDHVCRRNEEVHRLAAAPVFNGSELLQSACLPGYLVCLQQCGAIHAVENRWILSFPSTS